MNYRMVLFTLILIDFLAYVTIQFFSNSNASLTQSGSLDPDINFNADDTPATILLKINLTKCSDVKIILMPISLSYILIFGRC